MKQLAIVGATSQIARDLIFEISEDKGNEYGLLLYARNLAAVDHWLKDKGLENRCRVYHYSDYGKEGHDAVINFIGIGDPAKAKEMGREIFDITLEFDDLILNELREFPSRQYIFLSSGAAYGSTFLEPATSTTKASLDINNLSSQEFYSVAKLHAECRHRSYASYSIVDVRVFNYFSRTMNLESRFFIADIIRAIKSGQVLEVSGDDMVRDFIHPKDFYQLIKCVLNISEVNRSYDCYSKAAIRKEDILVAMKKQFGLKYKVIDSECSHMNATGLKPNYFSKNHLAEKIGYSPNYTSLTCLINETSALLSHGN